jgi:DNA polymerase-3 subunit epsilon
MSKLYAVVDLETTGGRASRDRVTEIAVVLYDGREIVRSFESLINPECYIPYGITQLTGITQEMVAGAPRFYEVAREIVELTEGAIFVAHNVRFDYSFLREEFARLGYTFSRKQLCTVRLSRQSFPGLPSYNLDSITRHLDIAIANRHRAMGDALATAEVLNRCLARHQGEQAVRQIVNLGIRESLLPKSFSLERLHALPEACGVYYFHDRQGNVLYVGKSINIKKRVFEHFADKTDKAAALQEHVDDLTYELTGSELVALLLESHEIKRLRPPVNRAQRRRRFPYVIHTWTDETGYRRFAMEHTTAQQRRRLAVISEFPSLGRAKSRLAHGRE